MLFEIRPNLEQSRVFLGLNGFLREVMLASLEDRAVDQNSLPNGLCTALAENAPTQGAVSALEAALVALDQEQKDSLRDLTGSGHRSMCVPERQGCTVTCHSWHRFHAAEDSRSSSLPANSKTLWR